MRIQTPAHRLFFPVTRYLYRHADAVVAGGEHVKRYLISEGVEAERIFSCGNATRNEDYTKSVSSERRSELRQDLGIRSEQKVVLSLGRVEKEKGLEDLIQAYARIADRNSVLVIAGSGSDPGYRGSLEELGRSLGIAEEMRFSRFSFPTRKPTSTTPSPTFSSCRRLRPRPFANLGAWLSTKPFVRVFL